MHLSLAVLGLHCFPWAFSTCGEWGAGLPIGAGASHYSGLSSCRVQALGIQASVVVGHRLSSFSGQAW